jgi:hypothetical protein
MEAVTAVTIENLGKVGIWARNAGVPPETASQLERLGYSTIWLGSSPTAAPAGTGP